jgi:hypothetical protein
VRTHSLRTTSATGLKSSLYWLQCRGCGERWPYDVDRRTIEAQPCGTPETPAEEFRLTRAPDPLEDP